VKLAGGERKSAISQGGVKNKFMAEKTMSSTILKIVMALTVAVFIWSGIKPHDYFTWFLEVVPALIAFVILALTFKKFRFSNFIYILICFHAMILMIGGHYTYAEVPLFNWLRDTLDLSRNYYDRLGHLAQGFVPALIASEIIIRKNLINGKAWRIFFIIFTILGFSAFYEFFEWGMALATGDSATAFLGTQGDVWDTQWDMFMCLIGSIVALALFSRYHEKKLEKEFRN
jgi:putative membrane protein